MAINLDHVTQQLTVTDTAANADLTLVTKGTGAVNVNTANGLALKITDAGVGTIENYWRVEGRNISGSPTMYVEGAGTNINTIFTTKGAGSHNFTSQGSRSNTQFQISSTTSAVNYVQVTGAATGGQVFINSAGSDSNIGIGFTAKLFANTTFFAAGGFTQFQVGATASSVNYLQATGAASGASPVISAQGSDTNIDVTFTPKGTGNVRFGTFTGTILTPTGYVEIKDSGGTVRRLLVG
jgi:hypothetical protein